MRSLTVAAPAKVNLFLHVTGRRADGYHSLESLMAPLDFGDTVTIVIDDADSGIGFRRLIHQAAPVVESFRFLK